MEITINGEMDLILIILLIVGCVTSYPAYKSLLGPRKHLSISHAEGGQELYEDEDGTATQETELQYSKACRQRTILALAAMGIGLSLATTLLERLSRQTTVASLLISGLWVSNSIKAACAAKVEARCAVYCNQQRMLESGR